MIETHRMNTYMIDITLPEYLSDEFVRLIPRQRAHVDSLMVKGIVTSYSLAFDRSRLWVTLKAESEYRAAEILAKFPLHNYFNIQIHELAFQNITLSLAKVSLN